MPWHRVALTSEQVAAGVGIARLNELEKVFLSNGFPADAAVFFDLSPYPDGSIDYFNPGASRIAAHLIAKWGGTACEDPGSPVGLSIGHQGAYQTQNATPRRPDASDDES